MRSNRPSARMPLAVWILIPWHFRDGLFVRRASKEVGERRFNVLTLLLITYYSFGGGEKGAGAPHGGGE